MQEDEVEHNFPTMVLARSRSGDNYTEMTSPLSPMSQVSSFYISPKFSICKTKSVVSKIKYKVLIWRY